MNLDLPRFGHDLHLVVRNVVVFVLLTYKLDHLFLSDIQVLVVVFLFLLLLLNHLLDLLDILFIPDSEATVLVIILMFILPPDKIVLDTA